jgi:nickel-dependent lactate racemase
MKSVAAAGSLLSPSAISDICAQSIDAWKPDGKRLLVLIPDHTRSCPMDVMFREIYRHAAGRAKALDFMIALGTHPPLSDAQIYARVGITADEHRTRYPRARFMNHAWDDPSALTTLGTLTADEIGTLSGGRFEMDVPVEVNRAVGDYDLLIIIGPVFPHEVVGCSGGNKYIFPGISGPGVLNFFHWLGAVISNPVIIGNKHTPVRAVIDRAASLLPVERRAWCMVVEEDGLAGLFAGTPEEAWSDAADLSRERHITWVEEPFHEVLSCCPAMYDELWTAAKCMYKLEPAIADGGRVIIYAPHLTEVSVVHGALMHRIGYHTRDYFLQQWDRFRDMPWGVLAHATHLKGVGTCEAGVERPRIDVVLASGIPEHECRQLNLGYANPADIHPATWAAHQPGRVVIPKAGERLYRWRHAPAHLGGG